MFRHEFMKNTLKAIVTTLLCCMVLMLVRATIKSHFPKAYAAVWGQPEPSPEGKIFTQVKEPTVPTIPKKPEAIKSPLPQIEATDEQGLFVTGILRHGRRLIAVMSDGSVRTDEDNTKITPHRLTYATRTFIDWDGKRYWVRPQISTGGKKIENNPEKSLTKPESPPIVGGS